MNDIGLYDLLVLKFPNASFTKDIILQDDGEGVYIKEWLISAEIPTKDIIEGWMKDYVTLKDADDKTKHNQLIYNQLEQLDLKTIRALREGNSARIAQHEQEAVTLRSQLLK